MKTPEEMQQLEDLFHRAVALEPDQRVSFIENLRSSNPDIGAEVESLIAAYEQKASFIESPAYEAELLVDDPRMQLKEGQFVGRYRIAGPLGRGGMGDVYLADDPSLVRQVALKLLPAAYTADEDRLRRFVREARAASALNHPNILTIYEIGEADGVHYIATEFVKGHTLRHHLKKNALRLSDAVDVAIQVASALQAAHDAGIIHRDIKPENIMLRPDGYVKVLDFGLAKLTEPLFGSKPTDDSQIPTIARNYTEPGIMMGTINYMSPEGARGLLVNAQTDIFSLGIVIYEMVAGRLPFSGPTDTDVIVSILTKKQPPLRILAPETPVRFEAVVKKALQKERNDRYQSASDLIADLQRIKQDLLFDQRFGESEQPTIISSAFPTVASRDSSETAAKETATTGRITATTRRVKPALTLAITAVAATVVIAGSLLWYRAKQAEPLKPPVITAERSLLYSVTVQKYRDGKSYDKPFRLRDDINFEKDYRIRLNLSSPQNGYLYLLNEELSETGEAPSFVLMFPSPSSNNGSSQLNANQLVQIPEQSWFRLDEHQGAEKIWLVWADRSMDRLESLKRFANSKDKGLVADPQMSSDLFEFLKSHRPVNASVERDQDKTETVVRASGDVLVHVITLSHH
jgi:serine/threonine protein kinase